MVDVFKIKEKEGYHRQNWTKRWYQNIYDQLYLSIKAPLTQKYVFWNVSGNNLRENRKTLSLFRKYQVSTFDYLNSQATIKKLHSMEIVATFIYDI